MVRVRVYEKNDHLAGVRPSTESKFATATTKKKI